MKSLYAHQGLYATIMTGIFFGIVLTLPSMAQTLPRNEFNIILDSDGNIVASPVSNPDSPSTGVIQNTGYSYNGDKWLYYPDSGRYIQWYYNDPYDPARKALIDIWVFMESYDPTHYFLLEVTYCWARPEWSLKNLNSPPLPIDIPDSNTEHMFIQNRDTFIHDTYGQRQYLPRGGSIEKHQTEDIDGYNPEWVGISVSGVNVHVYRWMTVQCVVDEDDDGQDPIVFGACYNPQTHSCLITTQRGCILPANIWYQGLTCEEATSTWDFGDAPERYPVKLSDNGARHVKQEGIYLGANVSTEPNGLPSLNANGDNFDDGVDIPVLNPGRPATVHIKASVSGYINAWIDFNGNYSWGDPGEQIFEDELVVPAEIDTYTISIPSTAKLGYTYARFRFSTTPGLDFKGEAQDGEVEDYMVQIGEGGGGGSNPEEPNLIYQSPLNKYMPGWSQPAQQIDPEQNILADTNEVSLVQGPLIADDWESSEYKPVIGVRWWGTFDKWTESYPPFYLPTFFHIGMWTNDVDESTPSTLIWVNHSSGWVWTVNGFMVLDPNGSAADPNNRQYVFEFAKLFSQTEWFYPRLTLGTQYWISIAADYDYEVEHSWRWMTQSTLQGHQAVRIDEIEGLPNVSGQWSPSMGPVYTGWTSLDMDASFELLTLEPGPVGPGGDINGDGRVDIHDLSALMALWLNQN